MGLMTMLSGLLLGPNRDAATNLAVAFADQMAQDFGPGQTALTPRERAAYDRLMDGLNRLPRPLMALGSLALILAAMVAPVWFADRMAALAAMPDALWWLIGAVISLYFGARFQTRAQDFQRDMVGSIAGLPPTAPPPTPASPRIAETGADAALTLRSTLPGNNPALADWQEGRVAGL